MKSAGDYADEFEAPVGEIGSHRRRSLLRWAPSAVLMIVILADCINFAGTDLWMHIRFGQFVLQNHYLLRHDIYSYSAPGSPWFNHEWLADTLLALSYNSGGVIGLKLMKFICACAIVVLMADGIAETGASYAVQMGTLLCAAIAIMLQVQFRPQLFDYVCLAAILALLNRHARKRAAPLWLVIPIMTLWANLHGGFLAGVAVLAIYTAVSGVKDWFFRREWRSAAYLSLLTLAAMLATLINPFGIQLWYVVLTKFREPIVAMNLNLEFQSLPDHLAASGAFQIAATYFFPTLITLAGLVAFLIAPTTDDLPLVAIALMMTFGWIYAIRNMAFAVIAWTAPLAHHLDLALSRSGGAASASEKSELNARAPMFLQLPMLAVSAVLVAGPASLFSARLPAHAQFPVGAVAFAQRNGLRGNILTTYEWGGYVVWHEVPPSKIFFDSFDERYPDGVQYSYIGFLNGGEAGEAATLAEYPHDFVLIPTASAQDRFMTARKDWSLIYRDPAASLFARAKSPAAKVAGVPALLAAAPPSLFP
ncbi:MAG: hypothetical protein WA836_13870 [Candidatus Binataceae bacterium]